jgi:hypothetical protein
LIQPPAPATSRTCATPNLNWIADIIVAVQKHHGTENKVNAPSESAVRAARPSAAARPLAMIIAWPLHEERDGIRPPPGRRRGEKCVFVLDCF